MAVSTPDVSHATLEDLDVLVNPECFESDVLEVISSSQQSGIYRLIVADKDITAIASTPNFRYIVIYNNKADLPLICWYDYGATRNMLPGEVIRLDFDQVNGVFSLFIL
jgi:hypothetical protein